MANVIPLTKEQLYQDYIVNKLSTQKIAKKYNIDPHTAYDKLKKYNIPLRSRKETTIEANKNRSKVLDKKVLYQMYVVEEKSSTIIAKELEVSKGTVTRYLKQYGIEITHKHSTMRKNIDKDELYKLYIIEGKSSSEIGNIFNVSDMFVIKKLKQYGIPVRTAGETLKLQYINKVKSGEIKQSHSESFMARRREEYYIWRKSVLKRDNFTCQVCGKHGGKLNAHHLNNFSEFKELRYELSNGITLCKNCHEEFHKIFGVRNNTKEQIEDFKKIKGVLK
jgi:transposase